MNTVKYFLTGLLLLQFSLTAFAATSEKEWQQPEYFSAAQQLTADEIPFPNHKHWHVTTLAIQQLPKVLLLSLEKGKGKKDSTNTEPPKNKKSPHSSTNIIVDDVIVMLQTTPTEDISIASLSPDIKETKWYFKSPG